MIFGLGTSALFKTGVGSSYIADSEQDISKQVNASKKKKFTIVFIILHFKFNLFCGNDLIQYQLRELKKAGLSNYIALF